MPSQMMDPQDLSPSFFSEDLRFHDESQNGFWKSNSLHNFNGLKTDRTFRVGSVPSSHFENQIPMGCQMTKGVELPNSYLHKDWKVNCSIQKQAIGSERAASHSLPRTLDHNLGTASIFSTESTSYAMERDKINILGAQHENGLFSSSLSELFSRKLQLSTNNSLYGHSMGATASHYEEEEPLESLEELEAQTIGNLLPDDDDLFAGVTDGLDCVAQPNNRDDGEDLDLFSSVGGMDLGEDSSSSGQKNSDMLLGGSIASGAGKHPLGEHPSRTLFVRNINSNVEDSELQTLFEQYGDIRTLYTVCKHRGFVMISYYDIRAALNAMKALQNKPLRHRKLDIHFSIPKDYPPEKDVNQGTLAVFNLEPSVSNDEIRRIFCVYGEIKEIRETPNKSLHKLIEFYDSRAAEAALHALNGSYIAGKQIKLEPSHPAGARQLQPFSPEMERDESGLYLQQNGYPSSLTTAYPGPCSLGGIPSSLENGTMFGSKSPSRAPLTQYLDNSLNHGMSLSPNSSLSSFVRLESVGKQSNLSETSHLLGQMNIEFRGKPNGRTCSLPEYHDGLSNGVLSNSPGAMATNINAWTSEVIDKQQFCRVGSNGHSIGLNDGVFGPTGNGSCTPSGRSYAWSTSPRHQPQGMMWPNSPSLVSGVCTALPQQMHAVSDAPNHMLNTLLPINNHHVGSAPSVNSSIWDRRHAYTGESPEVSVFHPGSLGSVQISGNSPHPLEFLPHNMFPRAGGNGMDSPVTSKSVGLPSPHQRCLMFPPRGQMISMMNSFDSPNERTRSRRNEGSSNQTDNKKQFELDIDRIVRGDDKRTTLMIKNIPNKYTSKMLLAAIDEHHKGTYDFIYLPIDFKNKCNVGYAFINMTDPSFIIPFYHALNGKKWEKFNSEKVASLAYARIQGKAALIAHFQNSSLMNEDKRCRPILFHTDGPNAGDQVPFPMGVNVRSRPNKSRGSTGEENNHEIHVSLSNGESSSHGESCGVVKDSN
nr:protein MEI2-like 4 isoform X1 [Ipomoea batatas]